MDKRFRIIILGAGFSKPAGLPLGPELWNAIRTQALSVLGPDNQLELDLRDYLTYRRLADGVELAEDEVELEQLLAYLDIEHCLALRGKDTWSAEGNQGQEIVKRLIGQIIQRRTPIPNDIPDVYLEFARRLDTSDIVITFNYDVLLEQTLDKLGRPYRLFPERLKNIRNGYGEVDSSRQEIVILKLHGSLDWFDASSYLETVEIARSRGDKKYRPADAIFNDPRFYDARPLLEGPQFPGEPLQHFHRISHPSVFYQASYPPKTAWILSPSFTKFVYASRMSQFWYGLGEIGGLNWGLAIVGLSLSPHDDYLRYIIYQIARNYQYSGWDDLTFGARKSRVKVIDSRHTQTEIDGLMERYRFVDQEKARFHLNGFDQNAVDLIFQDDRSSA